MKARRYEYSNPRLGALHRAILGTTLELRGKTKDDNPWHTENITRNAPENPKGPRPNATYCASASAVRELRRHASDKADAWYVKRQVHEGLRSSHDWAKWR